MGSRFQVGMKSNAAASLVDALGGGVSEGISRLERYLPEKLDSNITIRAGFDRKISRFESSHPTAVPDLKSVANRVCHALDALGIGDLPMAKVRTEHVIALERFLAGPESNDGRGYSSSSIHRARGALSTLFAEAVALGLVDRNPIAIPKSLRARPRKLADDLDESKRVLELDEVRRLFAFDPRGEAPSYGSAWDDIGDLILLAPCVRAGLRAGEASALQVGSIVDAPTPHTGSLREIIVRYTYHRKTRLVKTCTKTGIARHVPEDPVMLEPIVAFAVATWWPRVFRRFPKPHDILAPRLVDGEPMHRDTNLVIAHLATACVRLKIKPATIHDLRHTFITHLRRAGVAETLRKRLTHPAHPIDAHAVYDHYDWRERCAAIRSLGGARAGRTRRGRRPGDDQDGR